MPGPGSLRLLGESDPHDLEFQVPAQAPVLITVLAQDIDVKAAVVPRDGTEPAYCDAPNRRMGVETLLVEAPHPPTLVLRIVRNDHDEARGAVRLQVVTLPLATEADRRRLDAARLDARACLALADVAGGQGAADSYAEAARDWGGLGDRRRRGIALLHAAGSLYLRVSDWKRAAELAAEASAPLEQSDAPGYAAYALRLQGAALDQLANAANYDLSLREATAARARERLTEAERRFRRLGMLYEAGYALSYRGVSFNEAGSPDRGRTDFLAALDLFRQASDEPAQALALQSLAVQSYEEGRPADSVQEFESALALIPRDRQPADYAHTLHSSALPLRMLGRFEEAIARHHEAAQLLHQAGDRDGEARALHSLGAVMLQLGERERAAELLRAAIELRSATGARREQAIALLDLASLERIAGRADSALALDQQALTILTASHDRARASLALAQDEMALGRLKPARQHLESILRLELPRTQRYLGLALAELAALESLEGRASRSEEYFARAIAIQRDNGSELDQARTLKSRAEARLRRGDGAGAIADSSSALQLFDAIGMQSLYAEARAAFRASYRDAVELNITALLREAQAAARSGIAPAAQRLLHAALEASDRCRAQLLMESEGVAGASVPQELLAEQRQTYEKLASKRQLRDRLLDSAAPNDDRIDALSRDIELLRAQARLMDGRVARARESGRGSRHVAATTLAESVPPRVLVAEYFVGRTHAWLFEIQDGKVAVHALGRSRELEELARALHQSWRSLDRRGDERLSRGRALASRLFRSHGDAAPAAGLWIVPDGALHLVPMALLAQLAWPEMPAGAAVVIPALSALVSERSAARLTEHTIAIVADPVYEADDPRIHASLPVEGGSRTDTASTIRDRAGLRRLPSAEAEARELAALVDDPAERLMLTGPEASRVNLAGAALDRYRIVHFATHAVADSRDSALATLELSRFGADGRAVNGALRLYDIAQLRLNADLVVLSGCDTALGREIEGEAPIGLSHAFLRAGARAVVATLWQVPDTSTAWLMREFYREMLINGRTAPEALQLAQALLRRQPRWSDPYFWAGFQYVTNARLDAGNHNDVAGREES